MYPALNPQAVGNVFANILCMVSDRKVANTWPHELKIQVQKLDA